MQTRSIFPLLAIAVFVCIGCKTDRQGKYALESKAELVNMEAPFSLAVRDYKLAYADQIAYLLPVVSGGKVVYQLPESCSGIIIEGTRAASFLERFRDSSDLVERQLALTCIAVISSAHRSRVLRDGKQVNSVRFSIYAVRPEQ